MKTSPNVQVVRKTRCFTLEEKENIIRSHIICGLIPFFFNIPHSGGAASHDYRFK